MPKKLKIQSYLQLLDLLPESERLTVEVLRQIILDHLPNYCKEKISYNVHYLKHGTNKKIFYKIYQSVEEIEESAIVKLLKEALILDISF